MADPTGGEWIQSACPSCGKTAHRQTYDVGSGPELSCAWCEWCWGADGQQLQEIDWRRINHEEWAKRGAPDEAYRDFPAHPLHDVPKVILDTARNVMREAADWTDVDAGMADALADAVVLELRPWLSWGVELAAESPEPANGVDDTEVRSSEAVGVSPGGAPAPVGLPGGPEDAVGSQGVDGVALEGHHVGETTEPVCSCTYFTDVKWTYTDLCCPIHGPSGTDPMPDHPGHRPDSACARCGRTPAAGFAMIGEKRYCHPDVGESCYVAASLEAPRPDDDGKP
jgi:hypothetical protein